MTIKTEHILLTILIGLIAWFVFFGDGKELKEQPQPITITIPATQGTTGTQVIETSTPYPVYIQGQGQIIVDEKYKNLYENTKDSLEKTKLYLNAIKINDYKKTFVDNDTITITGDLKTRGDLLEYKIDYNIKPLTFDYTPNIVKQRPRFSMSIGVSGGIPTVPTTRFNLKGELGLENRKGNALTFGYDTESRVWVGVRKNFTIVK